MESGRVLHVLAGMWPRRELPQVSIQADRKRGDGGGRKLRGAQVNLYGLPEIVRVHIKDQANFLGQGGCGKHLLNMS